MHQQAHHHCHNHHTTIILTTPAILLFSSVCYHNGKFNAQVLKQIPVLSLEAKKGGVKNQQAIQNIILSFFALSSTRSPPSAHLGLFRREEKRALFSSRRKRAGHFT